MEKSGSERRVHPRFPYVLQISYPSEASRIGDFTEDLSESGLFIRTDRDFPIGARVKLNISFTPLLEPLSMEVEVVRLRKSTADQPAGVAVRIPEEHGEAREKLALLTRTPALPRGAVVTYRVLIADDNVLLGTMFGDALRSLLPRAGVAIEVEVVRSGQAALDRLAKAPSIDLLITDRFMEPVDGFSLIRHIREQPRLKTLPVVMVSSSDPEVSRQALELGANVYLSKPVNFVNIVKTVQTLLGAK
jgi:uncharacterized protein (TIGR02266 family)